MAVDKTVKMKSQFNPEIFEDFKCCFENSLKEKDNFDSDEEIKRMIAYYWIEWGNLSRWSGFHKNYERIKVICPDVIILWDNYRRAERALTECVERLQR